MELKNKLAWGTCPTHVQRVIDSGKYSLLMGSGPLLHCKIRGSMDDSGYCSFIPFINWKKITFARYFISTWKLRVNKSLRGLTNHLVSVFSFTLQLAFTGLALKKTPKQLVQF